MAQPTFSIIIPTYARPERLQACLTALAQLNYPLEDFEVIVVDDGSPQPPETLVASLAGKLPARLILQAHAGPAQARNTGVAQARGEYLAFTDDDCAPDPDWLRLLAVQLIDQPSRAVGGQTINALPQNPYAVASQDLITYLYLHYNGFSAQAGFLTSNNLAVSAKCFRDIGGFDKFFPFAAAEDRDFCDRWLCSGFTIMYVPEARVYHAHALTGRSFWWQHFNYGRGAYHFHRLRARRTRTAARLQPPGFYWNLVRSPFQPTQLKRRSGLFIAILTVLSQVANTSGYLRELSVETARRTT